MTSLTGLQIFKLIALYGVICLTSTFAIKLSLTNATSFVGDKAFLIACQDESGRAVTWSGPNGIKLGPKTRPKVEIISYGTGLYFENVKITDTGTYTCSAEHNSDDFVFTVEERLVFIDSHTKQTTQEYTNFTIRCEVVGGDVSWIVKNGDDLPYPKFEQIADGLLIRNVTREDAGIYICLATQRSTGDNDKREIQLIVHHKPEYVKAKQEIVWGYINGTVNLTCEVHAVPPPDFTWFKAQNEKREMMQDGFYNEFSKSTLQVTINNNSSNGKYICSAENYQGTLESVFTIELGYKPLPPDYIELLRRSHNLLDFKIHMYEDTFKPPEMNPTGYLIMYRLPENENWEQIELPLNKGDAYTLRGLQNDTEYEVKVATKNLAGLSEFSNSSFFRTSVTPVIEEDPKTSSSSHEKLIWVVNLIYLISLLVLTS